MAQKYHEKTNMTNMIEPVEVLDCFLVPRRHKAVLFGLVPERLTLASAEVAAPVEGPLDPAVAKPRDLRKTSMGMQMRFFAAPFVARESMA
jgi:hypothetical protein